ncbi:cytochrome ubiquinol oxidase subunit I [Pseudomonas soli]|uniref:cytochrome ubiquinol oxidase subunit I n=1 Tax=Pseudomonas soli TaxID=1306993 RepID=UPI003526300A
MIEHADAAAALLAARAQFAITIGLHIVLAAFSIGLAQWLMALEAWWLWRRQPAVLALYRYWLKVFALTVAAGTAFGLVMEYQFGLNWARLSLAVGEIIGPLMLYEVLVAFFLKAGFLGVMLFGQNKVGPKLHFFATCAVACALALVLVLGYSWLGACWLYWRCEGPLQRRAASQAKLLCGLALAALAGVLALTLQLDTQYWHRLGQPSLLVGAGVASIGLLVGFARAWRCAHHWLPLSCALGMIVVAFTFMLVALFPNAIPPALTLEQAAASAATQVFVLVGFALVVPVTLGYNTWGFRVCSGKVRARAGRGRRLANECATPFVRHSGNVLNAWQGKCPYASQTGAIQLPIKIRPEASA